MNSKQVSIIIPVLNEAPALRHLLPHLLRSMDSRSELLVVDGGSTDGSPQLIEQLGVPVLRSRCRSRAVQMNTGAQAARGSILYFLHADAWPPASFLQHIRQAVAEGHPMGCFQMVLSPVKNRLTRINTYFAARKTAVSGGGDQSLYVETKQFWAAGGFNEAWPIMEDFELVKRLEPELGYYLIARKIIVSARKYRYNSYLRVNGANLLAFSLFKLGASPQFIKRVYRALLRP